MGVGIYVWFSLFALVRYGVCESFPSLLTTNASIAIVIDREFLAEEYDQAKAEIDEFLVYAKREILKHGGVNVYFYSWTAINVRKDLTAIFSIASCYDTWKLFKTTEGEDLVHMAISEPDCPRLPPNTAMTIPLITSGEELPQIILDLRESNIYVWKTLVVIYDSTVNRDMITRVIKSITQSRNSNAKATGISLMKLDVSMSRSDLREVMSTINPKVLGNNYLVIASYYLVGIVMEHAKSLNLASTTNQWMYIISNTNRNFQDIQMFESLLKEGDNIAYLYNASFTTNKCVGGRKCHMEELFKSFTRALDLAIQEEFDTASQVSEEEWEAIRPVKSERRDFLLKNMKNPPWQILKFNSSGDVIEYSGLIFDVIFELSRNLNFTFRLEIVNKTDTGSSNSTSYDTNNDLTNKVPKILVDLIKNKTVALGACAVTVTDDMKLMVNFTRPITILTYTFLVSRPKELSRALLFISPFTMDTWLGLATAIVSMGPLLYFIHRHSPVYEYKGIAMKGGLASIQNCIWYMYGALLQQGGMHLPYADSARLLVGAWWLVVLIMATTYCGNLVAFLTFPKIDIPITTLEDLIAHKDTVSWSFREGSYLERELRASNEHRYRTIFEERSRHASTDDDAIIQNIEDGKHVYIDWKMKLQFIMKKQFMKTGRCDFVLGLEEFFDEKLSLVVAPESPYLPKINEEIKKLHQMGLIEKWLKDYLPKRDRCWKNRHLIEVNNHTVNLDDMQGSFFVLFMGFTASLLILLFEKLWNKHFGKHKQKTIQPFVT
uniref:Ionotropic receptor 93a isoform X2 n=1 Tax=Diabrotica virgifera virgifera TaxID=50390 RepID=A0A6P7FIH8_DIAVI